MHFIIALKTGLKSPQNKTQKERWATHMNSLLAYSYKPQMLKIATIQSVPMSPWYTRLLLPFMRPVFHIPQQNLPLPPVHNAHWTDWLHWEKMRKEICQEVLPIGKVQAPRRFVLELGILAVFYSADWVESQTEKEHLFLFSGRKQKNRSIWLKFERYFWIY